MIKRIGVLGVALALVSVHALADDKKDDFKWDAKEKATPKVGDRSFEEGELTEKGEMKATVNGKVVQQKKEDSTIAYRWVRQVLAVEKDDVSEARFKVEKWKRTAADEEADTSLEGKTVLVKGLLMDKTFTIEDDKDDQVSDEAKKWIQSELAKKKKSDDDDDPMKPEKPVGNNEEWTRDPEIAAKSLKDDGFDVDAAKSSIKGKLSNVHVEDGVHVGHVDVTMKLALKKLSEIPLSEGAMFEVSASVDTSLELKKRTGDSAKLEAKLTANGEAKTPNGTAILKISNHRKGTMKSGSLEPAKDKK